MANTVSNSDGETESFVSEARVPLLGLPLEDAEAGLAPIRADEGSKELPSIIQTKNAHETTPSSIYTPHILDEDSTFHSTDEGAIIDMTEAEIPHTPSDIPPPENEPAKPPFPSVMGFVRGIFMFFIILFFLIVLIVATVEVAIFTSFVARFMMSWIPN